jgi:hypothetical protein
MYSPTLEMMMMMMIGQEYTTSWLLFLYIQMNYLYLQSREQDILNAISLANGQRKKYNN